MELHKLEGLKAVVLARSQDTWVQQELRSLIDSGEVTVVNVDEHPEALKDAGLKPGELTEPMVLVSQSQKDKGELCAISRKGNSIIAHCDNLVVPLTSEGAKPPLPPAPVPPPSAEDADRRAAVLLAQEVAKELNHPDIDEWAQQFRDGNITEEFWTNSVTWWCADRKINFNKALDRALPRAMEQLNHGG